MFFKIVFFYMFLIGFETVSRWRCNIPPPGKQSSFSDADGFKSWSQVPSKCAVDDNPLTEGVHSKLMHFFNQLPFAWIEEMNEVWHDCHHFLHSILQKSSPGMIKSAKQQGANMTRTDPTHNWECRVWNKQKRDLNLLSQDHPAPVVCKNNIIPPSAPNQNTKDMQFVFFVSDTAISICVCELQKKNPIIIIKMFPPKQALTRSWVVLGFRRCWRVKHLFKDLLCVSDVALHAISDLSFNLRK